jgi:hypothetical protein
MSIENDLVVRVQDALETYARKSALVSFSEIESHVGKKVGRWDKVLDPIYEELRALGKPDLTAIVIYKTGEKAGYPPWFSDGGPARSKRFNPNDLAQVDRWQREVARVFSTWRKER